LAADAPPQGGVEAAEPARHLCINLIFLIYIQFRRGPDEQVTLRLAVTGLVPWGSAWGARPPSPAEFPLRTREGPTNTYREGQDMYLFVLDKDCVWLKKKLEVRLRFLPAKVIEARYKPDWLIHKWLNSVADRYEKVFLVTADEDFEVLYQDKRYVVISIRPVKNRVSQRGKPIRRYGEEAITLILKRLHEVLEK